MSDLFLRGRDLLAAFDELERKRVYSRPELAERRLQRLLATPAGFFRGTPSLFYSLLQRHPESKGLLSGKPRWIAGDVHLENIGVIAIGEGRLVFDWNDLDEAIVAPAVLDVIRGAASAAISADSLGLGTRALVSAAQAFVDSYVKPIAPDVPKPIVALLERARRRTHAHMLDERCPVGPDGSRHFTIGKRYLALTHDELEVVQGLFDVYSEVQQLPLVDKKLRLDDAAFRVQGTGSLGVSRYIWLVHAGKKGEQMLVEAKEMRESALVVGGLVSQHSEGEDPANGEAGQAARVATAIEALLQEPQVGVRALRGKDGASYLVRLHAPGEDKFAIQNLQNEADLISLARLIGDRLSEAHRRAAGPIDKLDTELVVEVALDLASIVTRAHQELVTRGTLAP